MKYFFYPESKVSKFISLNAKLPTMAVLTRSMKKNQRYENAWMLKGKSAPTPDPVSTPAPVPSYDFVLSPSKTPEEVFFIDVIKLLLANSEVARGSAKVAVALQIFKIVNDKLPRLLKLNPSRWSKFAATVYNKTTEFQQSFESNPQTKAYYNQLVRNESECEFAKARKILKDYLSNLKAKKSYLVDMSNIHFRDAYNDIENVMRRSRCSKRTVSKVDYTGMDTIEPECEFDGITDIWADLTIYSDPDYVFEEEEEDEEEYYY